MANGDIGIGKIIKQERGRDAIHIAVAPVEAAHPLAAGQHVGLNTEGKATTDKGKTIGIVDPFLKTPVLGGEKFYLFLYPGTITSLAHYWAHPAFEQMDPAKALVSQDKAASEAWLREYAANLSPYSSPDTAYEALLEGIRTRHIHANGRNLSGLYDLEDTDELRRHAEIVTGERIDWGRFSFSCGC